MTDNINEISKKTLGSYIRKAANDANRQGYKEGANARKDDAIEGRKKAVNRLRGIETASRRLTKESTDLSEALEFAVDKNLVDFRSFIAEALDKKVAMLFESGPEEDEDFDDQDDFEFDLEDFDIDDLDEEMLEYIAENITEEDFDQLDEISKETLRSYANKARSDYTSKINRADELKKMAKKSKTGIYRQKYDWQSHEALLDAVKRKKGIEKAMSRLTKESEGE